MASHWTIGVPIDAVMRAEKQGGVFEEHLDALVEINVYRLKYYTEKVGVFAAAFICFVLASLAALGFWFWNEIFIALFMLLTPLMLVAGFSVRFAYKIDREGWRGAELRKKIKWRRFWNQSIGMCSIVFTTVVSMVFQLDRLGYNIF